MPTLGAHVVNKSATFNKRSAVTDRGSNPKRAKDLLYLRDVMADGDDVTAVGESEGHLMDLADLLTPFRSPIDPPDFDWGTGG